MSKRSQASSGGSSPASALMLAAQFSSAGLPSAERLELKQLYHALFRNGLNLRAALAKAQESFSSAPARVLLEFVAAAKAIADFLEEAAPVVVKQAEDALQRERNRQARDQEERRRRQAQERAEARRRARQGAKEDLRSIVKT